MSRTILRRTILITPIIITAVWSRYPFRRLSFLQPVLPLLVGISLLWTAWDPTYSSLRKAKLRGRQVRIQGKSTYNVSQVVVRESELKTLLTNTCSLLGVSNCGLGNSFGFIYSSEHAMVSA